MSSLALLVLVCAGAGGAWAKAGGARAAHDVPPYLESLNDYEQVVTELSKHLFSMDNKWVPLNDYRRHYAVIIAHIGEFAKWLSGTCLVSYEMDYIRELLKNIPLGYRNPQYVIDQVQGYMELANNSTEKIRDLIGSHCTSAEGAHICDVAVDQVVHGDPVRYKEEAKVLLLLGKLSSLFLQNSSDFVSSSMDYMSVLYLLENIDNLHYLIFAMDHVIKELNLKDC